MRRTQSPALLRTRRHSLHQLRARHPRAVFRLLPPSAAEPAQHRRDDPAGQRPVALRELRQAGQGVAAIELLVERSGAVQHAFQELGRDAARRQPRCRRRSRSQIDSCQTCSSLLWRFRLRPSVTRTCQRAINARRLTVPPRSRI